MRGEYTFGARLVSGIITGIGGGVIYHWLDVGYLPFRAEGADWMAAGIAAGVFFILGLVFGPRVLDMFY